MLHSKELGRWWAGRELKGKIEGGICNRNSVANHKSFFLYMRVKPLYIHTTEVTKNSREIKLQFKVISIEGANNLRNRINKTHSRSAQNSSQPIRFITCFSNIHSTSSRFLLHRIPKHLMKVYLNKCLITSHRTIRCQYTIRIQSIFALGGGSNLRHWSFCITIDSLKTAVLKFQFTVILKILDFVKMNLNSTVDIFIEVFIQTSIPGNRPVW